MVVGLTGGIGSGKTTVANLFEIIGCPVFYSDVVAKEIYFNETIKPKIINLLGKEAYVSSTKIDKKYISSKIFSDTNLLHQLNAIIHPAVIEKFVQFKELHKNKLIIKETALLFEAKLENEVDKIILVAANDELRIKRVMQRDNLSKEDVTSKIKAQLPQEEKILKSDFVIYNDEKDFLITQVLEIYRKLTNA
ncbi:MAG: dephospho-CoA kinase [Bacteroidota bacterium]|nr:dephospho-CoA kinase [Bacteroidota bacterium]MDP3145729.1 dephospho-CoA kinase [Bacteroidota bacterium]MDP3556862.1 dephospho-CoA kinase [Bacteroidota bacterium]